MHRSQDEKASKHAAQSEPRRPLADSKGQPAAALEFGDDLFRAERRVIHRQILLCSRRLSLAKVSAEGKFEGAAERNPSIFSIIDGGLHPPYRLTGARVYARPVQQMVS